MDVSLRDFRGAVGAYGLEDAPAALARLFGEGVRPLRMQEAVFAAMLDGWRRQQLNRANRTATIDASRRTIERLRDHAEAWPWAWEAEHVEQFIADLIALGRRAPTMRRYQSQVRTFLAFLADGRYPWQVICLHEFGRAPRQLFDERNLIVHIEPPRESWRQFLLSGLSGPRLLVLDGREPLAGSV